MQLTTEAAAKICARNVKLTKQIKRLEKKLASVEERRKKFDITTISKIKVDGHWYFKGTEILSCQ